MRLSEDIKPISYIKSHATEIIREFSNVSKTLIITHNGEAKAVMQDIASHEAIQESLALLKILALGMQAIEKNQIKPLKKVFAKLRTKKHE
jgi:hypothetical protein